MKTPRKPETRRTEGLRTHGRSARVVEKVLNATAAELGRSGYAALRIDDVAARSGVNKTTIYRRWPTKIDLVSATLRAQTYPPEVADTGTLRGDLLEHFAHLVTMLGTTTGRGVVRTLQAERTDPEVERMKRELRAEQRARRCQLLTRGIARGELAAGVDVDLLAELLAAPLVARLMHSVEDLDRVFLERAIDVILAGAATTVARAPQRGAVAVAGVGSRAPKVSSKKRRTRAP